jgi:hypothetical protein
MAVRLNTFSVAIRLTKAAVRVSQNQPLLWTGPRRVVSLFLFHVLPARRVARHRTSSVMRPRGRRFPKAAPDGTFAVRVFFASSPLEPLPSISAWLTAWLAAHPNAIGDGRPFTTFFTGPPELAAGPSGELTVVLRGAGDEGPLRFWKDWYVRICSALTTQYPEVGKVVRVGEFNLESQHGAKDFGWRAVVEAFPGSIIQLSRDACNTVMADTI